ncbi:type VII secretion integral membrane protein EccD [Gordonia sp. CPCC 206044]|uniref:type VII secretion integral membrane protein EccD n=1 Tax=Gordonia sp. CPCC 206044 TaxID=3140793 RepID=UPI003AF35F1F
MSTVETHLPPHPGTTPIRQRHPAGPAASEPRVEPEYVRVSVLGHQTQVDVGLPAAVPIAALLGDLVDQVETRTRTPREPDVPGNDPARVHDLARRWTLGLVGHEPIAPDRSLADAGIRDGDLLMLRSTRPGEGVALFDDVVDAVAQLNESRFANWSAASARITGLAIAPAAAITAALAMIAHRWHGGGQWTAGLAAVVAIALLAAATIVARHVRDAGCATALAASAVAVAMVSGMLTVPGPLGAAHLLLGCTVTLVAVVASYRLTGVGAILHSSVTTAAALGATACATRLLCGVPLGDVAAVTAGLGLLTIALSPRATIVLAKLPLPPVPTAGVTLDAHEVDPAPTLEGIGAIGAMTLPRVDALARRSHLANAYLTGLVVGAAVVTAASAAITAATAERDWVPVVFAVVVAAILCLRGRSHGDLAQAVALIGGGAVSVLAVIGVSVCAPSGNEIAGFVAALTLLVAAMGFGVVAPRHEFSPVMRRAAELGEYLLVVTVVPSLLWLLDLYQIVREL